MREDRKKGVEQGMREDGQKGMEQGMREDRQKGIEQGMGEDRKRGREKDMQEVHRDMEKDMQEKVQEYNEYVKAVTPKHSLWKNMLQAFLVGGLICVLGQAVMNFALSRGLAQEEAGTWTSISLVLFSVVLTGLNLYPKLAKFGGAGTLVPITGFANSVAAPAIEFQKEGQVFGIGCKIFTIAGPVILYGTFASWAVGLVLWVGQQVM